MSTTPIGNPSRTFSPTISEVEDLDLPPEAESDGECEELAELSLSSPQKPQGAPDLTPLSALITPPPLSLSHSVPLPQGRSETQSKPQRAYSVLSFFQRHQKPHAHRITPQRLKNRAKDATFARDMQLVRCLAVNNLVQKASVN